MPYLLFKQKYPQAFGSECVAYQRLEVPLSVVASPISVDSSLTVVSRSSAAPSSGCLIDLSDIITKPIRPHITQQGHVNQFMLSFRVSFA